MNIDFLHQRNKMLAQFIEFCNDTPLWQELQYKDAVRQIGLLAFYVSDECGIPLAVCLAKAWEHAFAALYGDSATFLRLCEGVKRYLNERPPEKNLEMAERVFRNYAQRQH